jgi:septum formation protein
MKLILASKSASRRALLEAAGIPHEAIPSGVDESAIKAAALAEGRVPQAIAAVLAEAKALAVPRVPECLVLGGDQVLEFEGRLYDKPQTRDEAAERLREMSGRVHYLRSGMALAQDGRVIWTHQSSAALRLRDLGEIEIAAYLDEVGEAVLATVGAYELEGKGVRLFDRIEGDYFSILGLPLLPLTAELRRYGVLPW